MTARALARRLRSLRGDRRGLALVEFAFAVPVLAILFVGGFQLMDAISVYRKATTTVRAMADLTTQGTSITPASAGQILAASQQIMAPYPTSRGMMRISQIKISNSGVATIDWSQALNGTAYTQGQAMTLPGWLIVPNTYLIYSEINYQYVPSIASSMIGQIPLRDTIYMSPRNSASIPCTGC